MPELAHRVNGKLTFIEVHDLGEWLSRNVEPLGGELSLDFEASGRHVDGNWATDASKCEPEARVSIAAMSWFTEGGDLHSVAIPFDQGMIGGKLSRYIKEPPKRPKHPEKCPAFGLRVETKTKSGKGSRMANQEECEAVGCECFSTGFHILPHTDECDSNMDRDVEGRAMWGRCVCAPWNFGLDGWRDLKLFWMRLTGINYFHAKYDMWIALAGLRDGAHVRCMDTCVGWQHDSMCLNAGMDLSSKLLRDVMVWEGITEPAEKNSLDSVARRYFHLTKDEGMAVGLKANGAGLGKRYDLVEWHIAGPYACIDAELTQRAKRREDAMLDAGQVIMTDLPVIMREHEKVKTLFGMEQRGVPFKVDLCREQAVKMHAEVDKLITGLPFKANSNGARDYFFGKPEDGGLGLIPIRLTDSGQPSCDAEVVARLTHHANPLVKEVAKLWQHIANMQSVCSKWYDAWPHRAGKDGKLRTDFYQMAVETDRKDSTSGGAISGRLSAKRVQLQGVPQDWRIPDEIVGIKALIDADPGCVLNEYDASNAEVRVTAWLAQCHPLADVINSGVNIHSANTVNIFGEYLAQSFPGGWNPLVPVDAFVAADGSEFTMDAKLAKLDKDGDPVYIMASHPEWKKIRTAMKRGIFGTIYASGVLTLKSQIDNDLKDDIPQKQIKGFMDALNEAYPEIRRTSKACERKVDVANGGPGFVKLVSGRRRVFGWGEKTYKALNACVQGGVAEMMSVFMIAIDKQFPGMLVNQVHDSVWMMIPKEREAEVDAWVKAKGKELFENAFQTKNLKVAFKFDSKTMAVGA